MVLLQASDRLERLQASTMQAAEMVEDQDCVPGCLVMSTMTGHRPAVTAMGEWSGHTAWYKSGTGRGDTCVMVMRDS